VKRRVIIPVLLAASVIVSLWVAGPFGTIGFLLRAPIILMNDLISIARQAFASPSAVGTGQPQTGTSGVTVSPVSTTGLAASLNVVRPSTNSAPPIPQPSPTPTPPPGVLVPPPNEILAPVEEVLGPAEPVLDPVQNAVDPVVDSVEKTLEPVTNATEPVTDAVDKALEPVKDATGGSGGGSAPDAGGAVHDVTNALDKIGVP